MDENCEFEDIMRNANPESLTHQLYSAMKAIENMQNTDRRQPQNHSRKKIEAVRAAEGRTTLQAGSKRRSIMDWIRDQPDQTATLAAIEAEFESSVRGHVHKLIEVGHLEVLA